MIALPPVDVGAVHDSATLPVFAAVAVRSVTAPGPLNGNALTTTADANWFAEVVAAVTGRKRK